MLHCVPQNIPTERHDALCTAIKHWHVAISVSNGTRTQKRCISRRGNNRHPDRSIRRGRARGPASRSTQRLLTGEGGGSGKEESERKRQCLVGKAKERYPECGTGGKREAKGRRRRRDVME